MFKLQSWAVKFIWHVISVGVSRFDIDKELENVDKVEEPKANGVESKSSIKIQPVPTKG